MCSVLMLVFVLIFILFIKLMFVPFFKIVFDYILLFKSCETFFLQLTENGLHN